MKKKKRLLAFVMAILLVITSVTIDYRLSEAQTVSVDVKIALSDVHGATEASVQIKDGETVVKSEDNVTISGGEISLVNVDLDNAKSYSVSVDLINDTDDKVSYKGSGSIAASNDENPWGSEIAVSVTISEYSYGSVTVTGLSGYTNISAGTDYSLTETEICKNDGGEILNGSSITISASKDGKNYKKTITVNSSSIAVSMTDATIESYSYFNVIIPQGFTITKMQDNFRYIDGKITKSDNSVIASTDEVTIFAEDANGLEYSAIVTPQNTNVNFQALQYQLSISNENGASIYYCEVNDAADESLQQWTSGTKFEKDKDYQLVIEATAADKILRVTKGDASNPVNVDGSGNAYAADNADWKYRFTSEVFSSDPGKITVKEDDFAFVEAKIINTEEVIYPETEMNLTATVTMEAGYSGYSISDVKLYKKNIDGTFEQLTEDGESAENDYKVSDRKDSVTVTLHYNDTTKELSDTNVKIEMTFVNGNKSTTASKEFKVQVNSLVYGTDFEITGVDPNSIYRTQIKDIDYLFYGGSGYTVNVKTDGGYKEFRYNDKEFKTIDSASSFSGQPSFTLQMRNTTQQAEKFGISNPMTVVQDTTAPGITFSNESLFATDDQKAYVINGGAELQFAITLGATTESESGLRGVYYSYTKHDNVSDIINSNEILSISEDKTACTLSRSDLNDDEGTVYIYAVDNVYNFSLVEIKYVIDETAPEIVLSNAGDFPNGLWKDKTTYETYYSFLESSDPDNKTVEITVSDLHLDVSGITAELNGVDIKLGDSYSSDSSGNKIFTFNVEIGNRDATNTIIVSANDTAGTEANKKTITINIIVDSTEPEFVSAVAAPLAAPSELSDSSTLDETIKEYFSGILSNYNFYNGDSVIELSFNEAHYKDSSVTLGNYMLKKDEYNITSNSYSCEFPIKDIFGTENISGIELEKGVTAEYTVTDLAENSTTVPIMDAKADNMDVKADKITNKKIVIVNKEINIEKPTLDAVSVNGFNVLKISEDNENEIIKGTVKYSNVDVNKDFLKLYLKDVTDETIPLKNVEFELTGEKCITYNVATNALQNEHEYQICVYYYDACANQIKEISSDKYCYDGVEPVLISEVRNNNEITYTLVERFPDFENFNVDFNATNNDGNIAEKDTLAGHLKEGSNWSNIDDTDDTYKITLTLPEGVYDISVIPKDVSRPVNEDKRVNNKFTYDSTAPVMDKLSVFTEYNTENTDYSQFDPKKATIEFKVKELVSQNVYIECTATDDTTKRSTIHNITLSERDGSTFTGKYDINADFKGTLEFVLKDDKQNISKAVSYENNHGNIGLVVEGEEKHTLTSNVSIETLNEQDAKNGIFNEPVKLALAASDTYSGIRQVEYIINGASTMVSSNDTGNITYNWNTNAEIAATKENEGNDIKVKVVVTDNAGYTRETEANYKIDITAPVIRVSYDNNSPLNERYYNATRTATIEIDEYNFDLSGVVLNVKRDGVSMNIAPNFRTDSVVKTDTNGKPYYTYIMNLPFAEDGDYEFSLTVTDAAGNVASYGQTDTFTIDKTNPEMSITYDNNEPYSGQYYGEGRTATIKVTEHNFDANDVVVNLSATVDGVGTTTPSVGAFTTNGDVHTAVISFNNDADYTISASCKDLAGNDGNSIDEQAFTVDLTAPEIEITGVDADTSYVDSVNPVVKVTDGNYDTDGVTITIVGGKHGTVEIDRDVAEADHGQTFSYADLQHTQENDDYYVITATAVDKAGHETEETVSYRVNRFGSIYLVNDDLQTAIDQYYAPASDKYAIIEENVDELDSYTVTYTIDNEIVNLEEDRDYTVSHTTNKDDWQQYEYKLAEETFSREGIYNISISSKDAVGNVSDNKSKDMEMEFCIDNTKPVCIISGVSENQEFEQGVSANIVVEAYDNIKFADMKIMVNGEELKTEKDMVDGKVSFTIAPVKGDQTLTVICHDAAGNEELQEIHFSFDVGALGSHAWLIILLVVLLVLIATILIFFIIAKRRKTDRN